MTTATLGIAGVTALSADAAPQTVSNATFTWGLNALTADGVYHGGNCFPLGAGPYTKPDAFAWSATAGNVTVLKGETTAPTIGAHCTVPNKFAPHGSATGAIGQSVKWTGGTGTVDPATGEVDLAFAGAFTGYFYTTPNATGAVTASGGAYTVKDLQVKVNAAGDGQIIGDLSGFETNDASPPVSTDVAAVDDVVIGTFDAATGGISTGFSATPHYAGVPYTAAAGEAAQTAGGGSWPASFNNFIQTIGFAGWFYEWDGSADNPHKPPSQFTLAYELAAAPTPTPTTEPTPTPTTEPTPTPTTEPTPTPTPGPGDNKTQSLAVTVADAPGVFSWEIPDNGTVNFSGGTEVAGDFLEYTGDLNPVHVTDARDAGNWTISGVVGPFTSGSDTIGGQHLGWDPAVTTDGANAVEGALVAPGTAAGEGLASSRPLATGSAGDDPATGILGADFTFKIPGSSEPGSYTATLTLTALTT